MKAASPNLLDRLVLTPSRNGKLTLLVDYFRAVEDPDRGLALAAITGDLSIAAVKPAMLRALVAERMDPVLFGYSYDYVGDLAETVSLVWPDPPRAAEAQPSSRRSARSSRSCRRPAAPTGRTCWRGLLDSAGIAARFAIIKLVTGGLRIGVSARLAKQALADFGKVDVAEIEELWHGLTPPYAELFAWLEGKADKPEKTAQALFRPVMLSNPVERRRPRKARPGRLRRRVEMGRHPRAGGVGGRRAPALFAHRRRRLRRLSRPRRGDEFFDAALDGELLVGDPPAGDRHVLRPAAAAEPQERCRRRCASNFRPSCAATTCCSSATRICAPCPSPSGAARLEAFVATLDPTRFDLSPLVAFADWEALDEMRKNPPHPVIEGVMLKRCDSPYLAGRPKGPWFKWKRDPHTVDAVLMYAQRGHGKRSSFYSDYTFGVWSGPEGAEELVPVGKAYFGFTDEELRQIDKYVRDNTIERFGPVRSVRADRGHGLVLEVAFEGLNRSTRHKSGVAMRFPRISRLRWDKPTAEADRIETLQALLEICSRRLLAQPTP